MAEVSLEHLAERLQKVLDHADRIDRGLARIEGSLLARKALEQFGRMVEGKIELWRIEQLGTIAGLKRRVGDQLDDLDKRLRRLEEAEDRP